MKRYRISLIIIILISLHSLYCELDFQHIDMLYDGYSAPILGNNVVKNGNRVLLIDSYGVSIYETTEDDLTEEASYDFPMVFNADLYGDMMAIVLTNTEEDSFHNDVVNIYDISNIEEPQLIHQIYTNLYKVFLKENAIILGFQNQVQVYSLDTLELLNTYQNFSLTHNIEDSDYFTIDSQNEENFYLCYLDSDGHLVREKSLGSNFGRPIIQDEKLLYCYQQFIDFYSIADSLTFERTFAMEHPAELELPGLFVFDNTLIAPSFNEIAPYSQYLTYYDISDIDNIIEIGNYEFFPELGQYKTFRIFDTIQWNDNFLLVINNFGVIYTNFNNFLTDYAILKYSRGASISNRFNNKLYVNYLNVIGCNNLFDISNIDNITKIETEDSLGTYFWFDEDNNHFVVKRNFIEGAFELYSFSDNNFNYIDTYQLSDFLKDRQNYLAINLWNGQDLVYTFGENIYWVSYEDGIFHDVLTDGVDEPVVSNRWFYYNSYFYRLSYSGLLEVYSKEEDSLDLVNTTFWTNNNNSFVNYWGIKDGLLTIGSSSGDGISKIYDLDVDPVNFTAEIDLNPYLINSLVGRYDDYYFYTGSDSVNGSQYCFYENMSYFNIYKKVGDEFIRVGDIYNHRQTWDFEILPQGPNQFTVFLCSPRGVDVYSCQATPNGDLEITPVTLNATNYPNPFNPETTISYDISKQGNVSVDIYNLKGQKVKSLLNETQEAGAHKIIWQGDNEDGKQVSSGNYFYKVKSGG